MCDEKYFKKKQQNAQSELRNWKWQKVESANHNSAP